MNPTTQIRGGHPHDAQTGSLETRRGLGRCGWALRFDYDGLIRLRHEVAGLSEPHSGVSTTAVPLAHALAPGRGLVQSLILLALLSWPSAAAAATAPAFVTKWGSRGSAPGQFIYAMGVAVGSDGSVYVADQG